MIERDTYPFGSAHWAEAHEMQAAGMFAGRGPEIGYFEGRSFGIESDAPILTVAGAGGGKARDVLMAAIRSLAGQPIAALDPRGELAAVSYNHFIRHGAAMRLFNSARLHDLPHHRTNPLDILEWGEPRLFADARTLAENLAPVSATNDGKYFDQRAADWICALMLARVEENGGTSLPDLYRTINAIESDPEQRDAQYRFMLTSSIESVCRTAGEMAIKQKSSPREFGSIMGVIYGALGFLNDPMLLDSLENPEFSLRDLCDTEKTTSLFIIAPAEYLGIWSPLLRLIFTVIMLYKTRQPAARRITMIVDEAGQLGNFPALLKAFTYGRGAGIRAWALFQDLGQIASNFGHNGIQGFLGSAETRQFFAVRDLETARTVSAMVGEETLAFDDPLQQAEARHRRWKAIESFVDDGDPFQAALDIGHYGAASANRQRKGRALILPEEILAMPEDRQILFISGRSLPPIYAWRKPYFASRYAGEYLPNPYHWTEAVQVPGAFGSHMAPVITEPVPPELAAWPQYQSPSGLWRYVEGYRPI